jgi:hypothetical protein
MCKIVDKLEKGETLLSINEFLIASDDIADGKT